MIPTQAFDDRLIVYHEPMVVADIIRRQDNRHGLDPSDFPSREAQLLVAVARPSDPATPEEYLSRAVELGIKLGYGLQREQLSEYLEHVADFAKVNGDAADSVVDTSVMRIRQAAQVRRATAREDDARKAFEDDPTVQSRQAYADAIVATNRAYLDAPTKRRTLADIMQSNRERRERLQGRSAVGIVTNLYPLLSDAFFGWRGVTLLAAMPGIGKTTLATAAMLDAVEGNSDTCGVFVSFEMPTETLIDRTTAQFAGMSQRRLTVGDAAQRTTQEGMRLSSADLANLRNAETRLAKLGGRVEFIGKQDIGRLRDRRDGRGCLSRIEQLVVETRARSGASRSFVVVDHFGCVPVENPDGGAWPSDTDRARHLLDGLVTLRDRLGPDDPIVVVAQLRKSDFGDPDIASIMGTADSGYAADAVVAFSMADKGKDNEDTRPDPDDKVEVVARVVKGRDMMRRVAIRLELDPATSRIRELERA